MIRIGIREGAFFSALELVLSKVSILELDGQHNIQSNKKQII